MKKNLLKTAAVCGLCISLLGGSIPAYAAGISGTQPIGEQNIPFPDMQNQQPGFGMEQSPRFDAGQMEGCMVIREAGDYTLTGTMHGTVLVNPGAGEVRLNLDGTMLDGGKGPAIVALSGDKLTINLPQGSMNGMIGGPDSVGALYSEVPVFFEGEGRLDVNGSGQEPFNVENSALTFKSGDIRMLDQEDAFKFPDAGLNGGPGIMEAVSNTEFDKNVAPINMDLEKNEGLNNTETQRNMVMPRNQTPVNNFMTENQTGSQQAPEFNNQSDALRSSTSEATEIVSGVTENSAMRLEADYDNATYYDVSEDSIVKISESGTYVVTGTSDDGSITVKKGTTGVVLVLNDLDLTSTSGATLSVNKEAEVQVIVSGTVTLTDNENPEDEYSTDTEVADAYDGAAIKVKADSVVFITGDGTLNINGTAKNGIKSGDNTSLIIGGEDLTVNINATNDGINGNYDVTILDGTVNVSAGDDGIHADRILTIGQDGEGPDLTVSKSNEGLEATVVNIAGGNINVTSTDDGINAANSDGTYEGEMDYAVNITGGDVTVNTKADGIDSNGSVNLIDGSTRISSANNGGDAGIDYVGNLYISDGFNLNNQSGVAGPDNMMGGPGMQGQMGMDTGSAPAGDMANNPGGEPLNTAGGNMGGGFGGQPVGSNGFGGPMGR